MATMTKSVNGAWTRSTRLKASGPSDLASAFLRLAMGAGLLSAVADRLGFWGPPEPPSFRGATFTIFCNTPPSSVLGAQTRVFHCLVS
jgi:hypothetical protein